MSATDFCSTLNLSGAELAVCQAFEKTPITINLLYKMFEFVEPKLPILTNGIEHTVKKNTIDIFVKNTILQQLPWFLSFIMLVVVLRVLKVISTVECWLYYLQQL